MQLVVVELATSRDQSDWAAMRAFAQTFDLAAAEAEIADLILRGLSAKEMAALKGRDLADIRNVMKSLFAKTRCKHQAELVRLIMTLCPPVRRA
ncbi:MAG: helix-turn-helix transcriptional regulator [Rhodospirillaceae bacterium]|nr:helix-turn-helix transcriptional regulator [Rhodospirillaceae bacterium]